MGAFHAGWRGTVKRIVEKGVGEMHRRFGSRPGDLKAAIGPGIHTCCYEVGAEVREKFESQFSYAAKLFREVEERDPVRDKYPMLFLTARPPWIHNAFLPKKLFLDLVKANRQQLLAAGVSAKSIEASLSLHQLPSRLIVFLSRREGQDRADDGCGGDPGILKSESKSRKAELQASSYFCILTSDFCIFYAVGGAVAGVEAAAASATPSFTRSFNSLLGLKKRNFLGGHFDLLAGLGIAPHPRIALAGSEAAKATYLNLIPRAQGPHHAIKDCFHDHFTVFAREFR